MSSWGYKPYVSVADRRKKAEKAIAKARKAGAVFAPIESYRGAMAKTFWGKAWGDNLEQYSDYANRLPRGRTYTRNGSVIDLQISAGEVEAQVMGSSLYDVQISVARVAEPQWQALAAQCAGEIHSMVELLQGRLSQAVMTRICQPTGGLFPTPKEIKFSCSCPDYASMCKHIAAVLYGVGARLDQAPELLFSLRQVDAKALIAQAASAARSQPGEGLAKAKLLQSSDLDDLFGIEMADAPAPLATIAAKPTRLGKAVKAEPPVASKPASKPKVKPTLKAKVPPAKKVAAVAPPAAAAESPKSKPSTRQAPKASAIFKAPVKPAAVKPGKAKLSPASRKK